MVIERITGGKPQEVRKTDKAEKKSAEYKEAPKTSPADSAKAEVSDRSKAAIKAYRIASETKPDISRAARVSEIKAKVLSGDYRPSSTDVTESILSSVIKGA